MEVRNEKIVFEGKRYRIYQWEQKLFNGETALFERAERTPSATIITIFEGKIVIQKQVQPHITIPFFCVPGGNIDPGEEPLEAAKRELLEEEGLESTDWEHWFDAGVRGSFTWVNHIFIARNTQRVQEPELEGGERIEHLLYTAEEFFTLLDNPEFRHKDLLLKLREIRDDGAKRQEFLTKLGVY